MMSLAIDFSSWWPDASQGFYLDRALVPGGVVVEAAPFVVFWTGD
jgi:hypothetical protein